jgi:hypothetical protein
MLMGINNKIPAGYAYFLTLTIAWVVFPIRHLVKVKAEANPFLSEFDKYFGNKPNWSVSLAKECKPITKIYN